MFWDSCFFFPRHEQKRSIKPEWKSLFPGKVSLRALCLTFRKRFIASGQIWICLIITHAEDYHLAVTFFLWWANKEKTAQIIITRTIKINDKPFPGLFRRNPRLRGRWLQAEKSFVCGRQNKPPFFLTWVSGPSSPKSHQQQPELLRWVSGGMARKMNGKSFGRLSAESCCFCYRNNTIIGRQTTRSADKDILRLTTRFEYGGGAAKWFFEEKFCLSFCLSKTLKGKVFKKLFGIIIEPSINHESQSIENVMVCRELRKHWTCIINWTEIVKLFAHRMKRHNIEFTVPSP